MKIPRVVKGQAPTLLEAEKANQIIDAVNALKNMKVVRSGEEDKFTVSSSNCILSLAEQEGGSLDASSVEMWVCINGTAVKKKFFIEE